MKKQLFSRDFRLSLAERPEKPLVKTRPMFGKGKNREFQCLEKRKSQIRTLRKAQTGEFECLEERLLRIPMCEKAQMESPMFGKAQIEIPVFGKPK